VIPVVTAAEMRAADLEAMQAVSHETLVERAGMATSLAAVELLDRVYGARVVVLCGPGSNGADGRVAARRLAARGAAVQVLEVADAPGHVGGVDLVVDAAFGTGASRPYDAPTVDAAIPVLAVDLPSGVDADTGHAPGRPIRATRTVAMGALKRGHLLADGASLSGTVTVAPIGIEVASCEAYLVDDGDLDAIPPLARADHKWRRAVVVVAGSPGIVGAPALACSGALGVQAGMVLLVAPDVPRELDGPWPSEVVRLAATAADVAKVALDAMARAHSLVVGPGLGRSPALRAAVAGLLEAATVPIVLDADALHLVDVDQLRSRQANGASPIVLTPHDGEFAALFGEPPGEDRFAAARAAAGRCGCTVLLKGPTTIVAGAGPDGLPPLLAAASGTPDLATPGTGDVLSGVVGGLLARGVPAGLAAALGAHLHGRAGAALGARCRASLLPDEIAAMLMARGARGAHRVG
jgi:hydroxyethylthiazole kinase-like uncharacterized protein yjeF